MDNFEYNNISIIYERMLFMQRYHSEEFLWQNKLALYVYLTYLNMAGFIVDGYNGIRHDAKNKQMVYLSLGLSAIGTIIDFYVSIKSPSKLRKLGALTSFAINGFTLIY